LAVTDLAALMVRVQVVPEAVSQPSQPMKMERKLGVAVRVTVVPLLKEAEQVAPQLIPGGLEVTVPPTMPAFVTVKVTFTVKLVVLVAVPPGVVTRSGPVVAPVGTAAWIAVPEVTVKLALTPLNVTAVAPVKFVPLSVTLLPTGPLVGVKLVSVGALPPVTMTVTVVESEFAASATVTVCDPAVANVTEKEP